MLVLTRRVGEDILLELGDGIPADMTVGDLFKAGPIVLSVCAVGCNRARIGMAAPGELTIRRGELPRTVSSEP